MRRLLQAEVFPKFAEVRHYLDDAAVIGLEERFQDQESEELMLSEVFAGELRGVRRGRFAGEAQCLLHDRTR